MAADPAPAPPLRDRLGLALLVCALAVGASHRAGVEPRLQDGLLVEVAGAVPRPGVHLVEVPTVGAALAAAGGAPGDATPLVGGSRVRTGVAGAAEPAADPLLLGHLVDVNEDGAVVLDALPGVGPATAAAILDHRARSGPFRSVEELAWVRGIGPTTLAGLRPLVGVGDVAPREPEPPIDLNRATVDELVGLPGIGPSRAAAIVADRAARGPFADVAALERVQGIGPATVARLGDGVVAR